MKRNLKKDIIALVIILAFSLLISRALFTQGFYTVHDDQQIARQFLFNQAITSGQFPVRWVNELGFGFGYPLFVFYPPFVYILGEIYHLLGFSFVESIKLVIFTSILASALAMYLFVKTFWGRLAGIVAALFYIYAPYRAVDIYVRGALAESFSFVWLPLILWFFYKLTTTNKSIYVTLSAILLALLMITHNLIFMPFMLLLPIYLAFFIWQSPDKKRSTIDSLLSIILAFGLSAFFWIPALLEKKYTIVDDLLLVNLAAYKLHFVNPIQLWNWQWGYGGSVPGILDGMSFKIGKIHIVLSLLIIAVAIAKRRSFYARLVLLMSLLFLLSAFMTTKYSEPIWALIPPLAYMQFPWRFLTFTTLFSAILAGAFIYFIKLPIIKMVATILLLGILISPNIKLFQPQFDRLDLTDKTATEKDLLNWQISNTSFEYLPKGITIKKSELQTNLVDIERKDLPKQKVDIITGSAKVEVLESVAHKLSFNLRAQEETTFRINVANFPGWQLKIDNKNTEIDDNNKYKLVQSKVSGGDHTVQLEFKNTKVRYIANMLTLITTIAIALYFLKGKFKLHV